uniref:Uncharacterized protein n=1 Tax=Mycena chlorophos TaxID=658473 RepID=A0ABQ0MCL1_MYCCL|nr:predicted protein [Mycena chlorophos]
MTTPPRAPLRLFQCLFNPSNSDVDHRANPSQRILNHRFGLTRSRYPSEIRRRGTEKHVESSQTPTTRWTRRQLGRKLQCFEEVGAPQKNAD